MKNNFLHVTIMCVLFEIDTLEFLCYFSLSNFTCLEINHATTEELKTSGGALKF